MVHEPTQMRILRPGDCLVAVGFRFATDDPRLEHLSQLVVADIRIAKRETHHLFAKLCQSDRFSASRRFVAAELVSHVDAQVMHDHRDARRSGAVGAEHGEKRCVRMICVSGVIEESRLTPFATADVRLGWQLPDEPPIRCVNPDGFLLNVLPLDQSLVASLDQSTEVMVDVMLGMPIVPSQMTIERLHRITTAHHKRVRAIHVVRSIDMFANLVRRVLAGVEVLAAEIRHSPVGRQFRDELLQPLAKVVPESCVIFKDDIRVDVFEQTLFENQ